MTRVSISRRNAEAIFRYLNAETTAIWMPAFHELRAALQPRAKSSAVKKREKRNRTKGAETREIYTEVEKRAGGRCEACFNDFAPLGRTPILDHFYGRGKVPQSARNCWLICWECDRQKTLNIHGSDHWRAVFQSHANSYGFGVEARKALDRNESRALVKKAAAVMEASR